MLNVVNGKALKVIERMVPSGLSHAATSFVESLKINSIRERTRKGRPVIVKRRNLYGARGADLINFYFRLAGLPIRFVSDVDKWRRWEAECFQKLNGDKFKAVLTDARTIAIDKLPGKSLWDHMNDGTLTTRMMRAAGREYRRAHALPIGKLGAWSHGDASMTNVIYDAAADRARLIDFEITHDRSLPAVERHADDLLVFLLDLIARVDGRHWLAFSIAFLRAYNNAAVVDELKNRLAAPTGLALVWWNVRTNFATSSLVTRRLQSLRRAIDQLALHPSLGLNGASSKRRPSMNCHATMAGTPTSKSRKRAISEMANAVSPGIPSRLPITR